MSFLYPAFLIGALAIAIPIVLHLLRRDVAPEVPFTAVRLLHRSPVERSRAPAAARSAAARRARRRAAAARRRVCAARTCRAPRPRRCASSPSIGRSAWARRACSPARWSWRAQAIDEAARGERDRGHRVRRSRRCARRARAAPAMRARRSTGLQPGFGATRYAPVFGKAVELAAGAAGRLVVVTDLQRAGWEGESRVVAAGGLEARRRRTSGAAAGESRRHGDVASSADRVVASIRNSGREARSGPRPCRSTAARSATATVSRRPPSRSSRFRLRGARLASGSLAVVDRRSGRVCRPTTPVRRARIRRSGSRSARRDVGAGGVRRSTCRAPLALPCRRRSRIDGDRRAPRSLGRARRRR